MVEPMGDLFGSQQAADAKIKSFDILTPCSNYLKIFLCAAYKPSCYAESQPPLLVRPCRSLCAHVYARCYPLMEKFQRRWSHELNCSHFLDDASLRCMNDPAGYARDPAPFAQVPNADRVQQQIDFLFERIIISSTSPPSSVQVMVNSTIRAIQRFKPNKKLTYCSNADLNRNMSNCRVVCDSDIEFSPGQKQFSRLVTLLLNVFASLTSSISILICLLRHKQSNLFPVNDFFYFSISILAHSLVQVN